MNKTFILLLRLLVAATIGFFLIRTISESDIWFHMAIGKEILRSGVLPTVDDFSLLSFGRPYHDSQWLFQVITAAGYSFAGFWWLQAIQVVLWCLILRFVYSSCRAWSSVEWSWLFVLITALACEGRFTIRPELVTYLAAAFFYYMLQQGRYSSRADIIMIAIVQVVWSNCHGIYVIGLFLVGSYFIEALIYGWQSKQYKDVRNLGILMCAVLVGCLVTPFGLNGLKFAWLLMIQSSPAGSKVYKLIYEMSNPLGVASRATTAFWFYFLLLVGWCITLLAMLWSRKGELPLARTMIAVGMLAVSLTGIRNMPLFAIVATPLIAEYLFLVQKSFYRKFCAVATGVVLAVAMIVWSPKPAFDHLVNWVPYRFGIGISSDYVPMALPQFLDKLNFIGPVYNSQSLGGFYEYFGYPRRIPFFDCRTEVYRAEDLLEAYEVVNQATIQPALWIDFLRRYGFIGLLIENGSNDASGLLPTIARDNQWRLVYLDYAASFWLRADYPAMPPGIDKTVIASLVERVDSYANVENLFLFLDKADLYPELRLLLIERASHKWANQFTLKNLGLLQMQSGNLEQAEITFLRLLKMSPHSRSTIVTLAQIALARSDRMKAERYLLKGLEIHSNDPVLLENLNVVRRALVQKQN